MIRDSSLFIDGAGVNNKLNLICNANAYLADKLVNKAPESVHPHGSGSLVADVLLPADRGDDALEVVSQVFVLELA